MKFSHIRNLAAPLLLLIPYALAQGTPIQVAKETVGDAFCLKDGQDGEWRKGSRDHELGSCNILGGVLDIAEQGDNCIWASNVWSYQHDQDQVFTQSSANTCGHCTTNFTCFTNPVKGHFWGTDDPAVYNNNPVTAWQIYES